MPPDLVDYFKHELEPLSNRLTDLRRIAEYVTDPQDRRIGGDCPPKGFTWECLIPWGSGRPADRLARKYPHWRGGWRRSLGKTYQSRRLCFDSKIAAKAFLREMYAAGHDARRNWVEY